MMEEIKRIVKVENLMKTGDGFHIRKARIIGLDSVNHSSLPGNGAGECDRHVLLLLLLLTMVVVLMALG